MASKTVVTIICDLSHELSHEHGTTEGSETVRFAVDGRAYEIDLCELHGKQFREQFAAYTDYARRARPDSKKRQAGRTLSSRERAADIRRWAVERGIVVSDRGRLPAQLVRQYESGHAA